MAILKETAWRIESEDQYEQYQSKGLSDIKTICEYFEKQEARAAAKKQLIGYAADMLELEHQGLREEKIVDLIRTKISEVYNRINRDCLDPNDELTDILNFTLAQSAMYCYHLLLDNGFQPLSLRRYRIILFQIIKNFPQVCINDIDFNDEETREIFRSFGRSPSDKGLYRSVLKEFLACTKDFLHMPVVDINWSQFSIHTHLKETRLIGSKNVELVIRALKEEKSHLSDNVIIAVLLAFYWGLRLSEIVDLVLGNLVLNSTHPYIFVRRGKGRKHRKVLARFIDPWVFDYLKGIIKKREVDSGIKLSYLLVDEEGGKQNADSISKKFIRTLKQLAIRKDDEDHHLVFHTLRHEYANRVFVLGFKSMFLKIDTGYKDNLLDDVLLDLARSMGHASPETTVRVYLHCFDYLVHVISKARSDKLLADDRTIYMSQKIVAAYLNCERRHVKNLIDRYEEQTRRKIILKSHSEIFDSREPGKEAMYISLEDFKCLLLIRTGKPV